MHNKFDETRIIIDPRDTLAVLKENPNFLLSEGQYEDIIYCVIDNMELDISVTVDKIKDIFANKNQLSSCFDVCSNENLENICIAAVQLVFGLWLVFKSMEMFDTNGSGNLTFPYVLTAIVGSNLVLTKDNIISSKEANVYGNYS